MEGTKKKPRRLSSFVMGLCLGVVVTFISSRRLPPLKTAQTEAREEPSELMRCLDVGGSQESQRHTPQPGSEECLVYEEPSEYIKLLSKFLVGNPLAGRCRFRNGCELPHDPFVPELRKFGNDWPPYGFTMVGETRLENLRAAILEVNRNSIEGAIAEFGVWRGGAMILANAFQKEQMERNESIPSREIYLFDAFASFGGYKTHDNFLAVSLEQVQANFEYFGFDPKQQTHLHFVKGLFNETTPLWVNRTDPFAILRIDGNFYASYQDVLYAFYEKVRVGGIVIFDDVMTHPEVKQCWKDFKQDHNIPEELVQIDRHSAWFRKRKAVRIDHTKKRNVGLGTTASR